MPTFEKEDLKNTHTHTQNFIHQAEKLKRECKTKEKENNNVKAEINEIEKQLTKIDDSKSLFLR